MNGIESALKKHNIFMGITEGDSMQPMLVQGRDRVIIIPPVFPLKKYDVPVYRRGEHYTMHRIIKVTAKGYIICGDNRVKLEKDITDRDIIGVLTAFYHNGEYISCDDRQYIKYSKKICRSLFFRRLKYTAGRLIRRKRI